jgi:predicted PurR-regulated permease PerM
VSGAGSNAPAAAPSYRTIFVAALLGLVGWLCWKVFEPFLGPLAWAVVLAVGVWKPWSALAARMPSRRGLAATLATVGLALVVLLPAAWLGSVVVVQATDAASRTAAIVREQDIRGFGDLARIPWVSRALEWATARTGLSSEELGQRALEAASGISSFVASRSGALLVGFLEVAVSFLLTMFFVFVLLRDGEAIADALTGLIPLDAEARGRIARRYGQMLGAIFRGSLLCAIVQGATGGAGWALAGLPSAVLAGTAMAILSLLPVGGTALVWLPGAVWLWFGGHHGAAIFLVLWGAIVTSTLADNFLKPFLIGGQAEMNTLVVFVGVLGGISSFGLLGVFIGPMALAGGVSLLEMLREMADRSLGVPEA